LKKIRIKSGKEAEFGKSQKKTKNAKKKQKCAKTRTDFRGKFGPPEADEVKKCAKTYVKKANMRTNIHGRTKKERR